MLLVESIPILLSEQSPRHFDVSWSLFFWESSWCTVLFISMITFTESSAYIPTLGREGGREEGEERAKKMLQCRCVLSISMSWSLNRGVYLFFFQDTLCRNTRSTKIVESYHSPLVVLNFSVLISLKIALYSSLCPHPGVGSRHRHQASGNVFLC